MKHMATAYSLHAETASFSVCSLSLSLPAISLWIFLLNSILAYHETCMALLTGKLSPSCFSGFETHSLHLIASLFPESRALAWTHLGAYLPTSSAQAQLEKKTTGQSLTSSNQNHNISSNIFPSPSIFKKSGRYLLKIPLPFNFPEIWIFNTSRFSPRLTLFGSFPLGENPQTSQWKTEISGWLRSWTTQRPTTQGCDSGGIVRTLSLVEGSESCRVCQLVKEKTKQLLYVNVSFCGKSLTSTFRLKWCSAIFKNFQISRVFPPTQPVSTFHQNRFPNPNLESLLRFSHQSSGAACCRWGWIVRLT